MKTVGELKKYLELREVPDDAVISIEFCIAYGDYYDAPATGMIYHKHENLMNFIGEFKEDV